VIVIKFSVHDRASEITFTIMYADDQTIRDRQFNLQGGGGLWFFVSFRNLFSDNTGVIKKNCRAKREIFFQNTILGYMTKTLNQIKKKFPPPKSEYFFQQHWESEYFF
jgi:ribosomal protein S17E